MDLLVMMKEPRAGMVKTRLCPPCTPGEAAELAEAAIGDTLAAAAGCGAGRIVVALDGSPGPWLPSGIEVAPQVQGPFGRRLAAAWAAMTGPTLQIGMDTPQLTAADLDFAMGRLETEPAVLGPACDGGWWALGLQVPRPEVFAGVAMSTAQTGARQRERLQDLGIEVTALPTLRDVDDIADARAVATEAPASRFATVMRRIGLTP